MLSCASSQEMMLDVDATTPYSREQLELEKIEQHSAPSQDQRSGVIKNIRRS